MDFIKNLIAGIVRFITGLFSKNNNNYYLELKEEDNVTSAPAPTTSQTVPKTAPETLPVASPVAAKVTKTEAVKIAVPTETNFATKYLIPTNTPRRRPGVNMNVFLDMANQAKTPG
ncbi:MAG: hypothetical protein AN481_06900 [Aphanizomenon flos-aquae LD13]|jgi:hypothetical protein|uniref:Uncharacterized protein n=1 Tax=Aphanizomenon flos-aquae LD13 TaxID=1710894 RepID=A0A1B7VYS5_APHFL|nr:hypothetical protein [Aphanizomenon flos-aquae UKL13-PB]OBQ26086.1 MAG: hypothetical protein AN481_06900 [Aphanizomenon flos-aquae LD13]HCQ22595.1 hypothetical protein [Anabaena sp. UBA12330]